MKHKLFGLIGILTLAVLSMGSMAPRFVELQNASSIAGSRPVT